MLIDCERMQDLWNLDTARGRTKKSLHARAAQPGLRGPLAPEWNSRDEEYDPTRPGVLHFTTLHTQPWRPFPDRFVYEPHPLDAVWRELESEADRAGFALYTQARPSARFRRWRANVAGALEPLPEQPLGELASACGVAKIERFDEAALRDWLEGPRLANAHPAIGCVADWSRMPDQDLAWVLDALLHSAERLLVLVDRSASVERANALESRLERAALHHPRVTWHLSSEGGGTLRVRNGGPAPSQHCGRPPRVWVLCDDRGGNTTQSVGLANALGWPWEEKRIAFDSKGNATRPSRDTLEAPWPELVIAAGARTAPVALDLRERARGTPRLVQLGRKGGAHAEPFDLVVTPRTARLWPHPRRVETGLPVCREPRGVPLPAFQAAPSPRVALLIGGPTARQRIDARAITHLAQQVAALLRPLTATLWVSTSRRSPPDTAEIIERQLPDAHCYRWRADDPGNPYPGLLAHAELLIVTGESESMLAEAAASEAVLVIARTGALRPPTPIQRLGERVVARAHRRPENERGTPRPQRGFGRFCARLVATGRVRPLRDLDALHRELVECGRAHYLEDALINPTCLRARVSPLREAPGVAERVRSMFESGVGPS
jgi:mitochondrial fission protein ELM1